MRSLATLVAILLLPFSASAQLVAPGNFTPYGTVEGLFTPSSVAVVDDADAVLWFAAVGTVGPAQRNRVNTLIAALKAGGSWARDDDLWLLVAENSVQALTSLKQRRLATAVAAPAFTAGGGYAFDGVANYLDTGFIPQTHKVAMAQDDVRAGVYVLNSFASVNFAFGTNSNGGRQLRVRPRTSGSTAGVEVNATGGTCTLAAADSKGFLSGSRSTPNATSYGCYKGGVAIAKASDPTTFATTGLPTHSLFIGAQNNVGVAAGFTAYTLALVVVGASLSAPQEAAEYAAVQAYMIAWGQGV